MADAPAKVEPPPQDLAIAREIERAELYRWEGCRGKDCLDDCDPRVPTCGRYVRLIAAVLANSRAEAPTHG